MQFRHHRRLTLGGAILLGLGLALEAQAGGAHQAGSFASRDRTQQIQIRNGLRTGQLNAREAAYLERGEMRIDRMKARDHTNGRGEQQRINRALDREEARIENQKNDAQTANPASRNSRLMAGDVERNVRQEQRIHAGVHDGEMTQAEAGRLQARESNADRLESRAGSDNRLTANEQMRINRNDNQDARAVRFDERNKARNPDAEQNPSQ